MGEQYDMKKEAYSNMFRIRTFGIPTFGIPIVGIIAGEMLMFFGQIFFGIGIHIINLLAIILMIIFSSMRLEEKNVLQCMIPIILLRIINLSMPQFFTVELLQYSLIYGTMFISIYLTIKNQDISSRDLGIDFKKFHIYLPVAVIVGTIMAIVGYKILTPISLIKTIAPSDIILMSIVMFVFIGPIEEIIFRSILQTRLEKIFNPKYAILLSGGLFGIMNSSYGIISGIIFATVFGVVNGYIFYKTRSLPFVIIINGTVNVMLFGVLSKVLM